MLRHFPPNNFIVHFHLIFLFIPFSGDLFPDLFVWHSLSSGLSQGQEPAWGPRARPVV